MKPVNRNPLTDPPQPREGFYVDRGGRGLSHGVILRKAEQGGWWMTFNGRDWPHPIPKAKLLNGAGRRIFREVTP